MFGSKPSFGTGSPGFGGSTFGSSTPFGQSTFGNKPSAFGSPSFGSSTPSLFGAPNTTASSGMFGTNTSTGFGGFGTTTTSGGGGLFGSQPTQTQTGGLFGSGGSAFGTQNKPGFGFNSTTSNSGGGLFGQQQQPSLFGQAPTSTGTSGLFSSGVTGFGGAQAMTGTTVKFNPVTASDTMVKNGQTQHINTRHQCVTCMKEYEAKSLEELRLEDYAAGRKSGGSQLGGTGMGFGGTSQPSTGLFGTNTTTSGGLFGNQTQNKPLFGGGTTTAFGSGTTGGGLFGQQQNQSSGLFNNKPIGFGAPTTSTTTGFGFNNNNTSTGGGLFGSTNQNKSMFGTGTGAFNQTSQPSAFSGGFVSTPFAAQNQPTTSLFGQQNKPFGSSFSSPTNTFSGFGTPSTSSGGGLFANTAANKPAFSFSNTNLSGFPTSSTGSLFAQKPANFNFPTTNAFSTPSFGNTGTSLFGNTQNKTGGVGTGFGNTSFNFGSSLGTSSSGFNFGGGSFGGFNSQQQQQQQQQAPGQLNQLQQQILAMATNPYGDSPLFKNAIKETGKRQEMLKLTNTPTGKSLSTGQKIAPVTPTVRPKPAYSTPTKQSLFDGLEEDSENLSPRLFLPKPGYKKLLINPKKEETKKNPEPEDITAVTPANDIQLVTSDITSDVDDRTPSILVAKTVPQGLQNRENDSLDDSILNLNVKKKPERTPPAKKYEDIPEENEENVEPDPTGICLRRVGYYTIPSLDKLITMMDDEGKIMVDGFTIGRKNYGSVFFPDRMDVANLDIDELVHFRRREITIYPDDDKKPPVGQGLNRRAQVTLDGLWPRDKTTNESITDSNRLADMNYVYKLENATYKKGAKFLDYRPETGSWVFEVPNF